MWRCWKSKSDEPKFPDFKELSRNKKLKNDGTICILTERQAGGGGGGGCGVSGAGGGGHRNDGNGVNGANCGNGGNGRNSDKGGNGRNSSNGGNGGNGGAGLDNCDRDPSNRKINSSNTNRSHRERTNKTDCDNAFDSKNRRGLKKMSRSNSNKDDNGNPSNSNGKSSKRDNFAPNSSFNRNNNFDSSMDSDIEDNNMENCSKTKPNIESRNSKRKDGNSVKVSNNNGTDDNSNRGCIRERNGEGRSNINSRQLDTRRRKDGSKGNSLNFVNSNVHSNSKSCIVNNDGRRPLNSYRGNGRTKESDCSSGIEDVSIRPGYRNGPRSGNGTLTGSSIKPKPNGFSSADKTADQIHCSRNDNETDVTSSGALDGGTPSKDPRSMCSRYKSKRFGNKVDAENKPEPEPGLFSENGIKASNRSIKDASVNNPDNSSGNLLRSKNGNGPTASSGNEAVTEAGAMQSPGTGPGVCLRYKSNLKFNNEQGAASGTGNRSCFKNGTGPSVTADSEKAVTESEPGLDPNKTGNATESEPGLDPNKTGNATVPVPCAGPGYRFRSSNGKKSGNRSCNDTATEPSHNIVSGASNGFSNGTSNKIDSYNGNQNGTDIKALDSSNKTFRNNNKNFESDKINFANNESSPDNVKKNLERINGESNKNLKSSAAEQDRNQPLIDADSLKNDNNKDKCGADNFDQQTIMSLLYTEDGLRKQGNPTLVNNIFNKTNRTDGSNKVLERNPDGTLKETGETLNNADGTLNETDKTLNETEADKLAEDSKNMIIDYAAYKCRNPPGQACRFGCCRKPRNLWPDEELNIDDIPDETTDDLDYLDRVANFKYFSKWVPDKAYGHYEPDDTWKPGEAEETCGYLGPNGDWLLGYYDSNSKWIPIGRKMPEANGGHYAPDGQWIGGHLGEDGNWVDNPIAKYGRWVPEGSGGHFEPDGNFTPSKQEEEAARKGPDQLIFGHFSQDSGWIPVGRKLTYGIGGSYSPNGEWIPGHFGEVGKWVSYGSCGPNGLYTADGQWIPQEINEHSSQYAKWVSDGIKSTYGHYEPDENYFPCEKEELKGPDGQLLFGQYTQDGDWIPDGKQIQFGVGGFYALNGKWIPGVSGLNGEWIPDEILEANDHVLKGRYTSDGTNVQDDQGGYYSRDGQLVLKNLDNANGQYQSTNDQYQSTNGQYQSTNDPYQSTNDQYQSTNGQYQSTNDPYQSTNDQYQSTNDPYQATNDQYQSTNDNYLSNDNKDNFSERNQNINKNNSNKFQRNDRNNDSYYLNELKSRCKQSIDSFQQKQKSKSRRKSSNDSENRNSTEEFKGRPDQSFDSIQQKCNLKSSTSRKSKSGRYPSNDAYDDSEPKGRDKRSRSKRLPNSSKSYSNKSGFDIPSNQSEDCTNSDEFNNNRHKKHRQRSRSGASKITKTNILYEDKSPYDHVNYGTKLVVNKSKFHSQYFTINPSKKNHTTNKTISPHKPSNFDTNESFDSIINSTSKSIGNSKFKTNDSNKRSTSSALPSKLRK